MERREFISLLGGAAASWPLAARAQQPERMRHIGVLMNRAADNPEGQDRLAAFHQGLQELGWNVGRNVRINAPDIVDQFRQTAGYVDRILKGAKPAEMPVQAPTKYQLMINLKTAKALGLDVHASLLARATGASQGIGAALIKAYRARNYPSIPPFFTSLVYDGV